MELKDFVFDVIVTKLEWTSGNYKTKNIIVKFKWDKTINLDITSSRLNVCSFRNDGCRQLPIKANLEDLQQKMYATPFKLQIMHNEAAAKQEQERENQSNKIVRDKYVLVGESSCNWAMLLIEQLADAEYFPLPCSHFCCITLNDNFVGNITLIIKFYCKTIKVPRQQMQRFDSPDEYVDKTGKLQVFKDVKEDLHPKDVFFVIGEAPEPKEGYTRLKEEDFKKDFPNWFLPARYKALRGRVIDGCDVDLFPPCGNATCDENKAEHFDALDDVLNRLKSCPPLKECIDVFGPLPASGTCDKTCTEMFNNCTAEHHMTSCKANKIQTERTCTSCPPTTPRSYKHSSRRQQDSSARSTYDSSQYKKTPRCCPRCARPSSKCKCKAMVCGPSRPYNADITASDILKQFTNFSNTRLRGGHEGGTSTDQSCASERNQQCPDCDLKAMFKKYCKGNMENLSKRNSYENDMPMNRNFNRNNAVVAYTANPCHCEHCDAVSEQKLAQKKSKHSKMENDVVKYLNIVKDAGDGICQCLEQNNKSKRRKGRKGNGNGKQTKTEKSHHRTTTSVFGHKYCIGEYRRVPKNMGWLWNANIESQRGWRPGAVSRTIHRIMSYFMKPAPQLEEICTCHEKSGSEEQILPALHVSRKNGEFTVSLHPPIDQTKILQSGELHEQSKPIHFTVGQNPAIQRRHQLKDFLRDCLKKCCCDSPIFQCKCNDPVERKELEKTICKACKELNIAGPEDVINLSESDNGEFEFCYANPKREKIPKACCCN